MEEGKQLFIYFIVKLFDFHFAFPYYQRCIAF